MPDYAPQYTPRVRMSYTCQGRTHRSVVRLPRGSLLAAGVSTANDLYSALGDFGIEHLYADWEVTGWAFCPEDTTVFIPFSGPTGVLGAVSTTGRPINQIAMQMTVPYRTAGGGHGFYSLYGTDFNVYGGAEQDFRVTAAEDAAVAAFRGQLATFGLYGNDNFAAIWAPYANIGFNARWKRRVRNG